MTPAGPTIRTQIIDAIVARVAALDFVAVAVHDRPYGYVAGHAYVWDMPETPERRVTGLLTLTLTVGVEYAYPFERSRWRHTSDCYARGNEYLAAMEGVLAAETRLGGLAQNLYWTENWIEEVPTNERVEPAPLGRVRFAWDVLYERSRMSAYDQAPAMESIVPMAAARRAAR